MTAPHLLVLLFGLFATGFLPDLNAFGAPALVLAIPLALFGAWTLLSSCKAWAWKTNSPCQPVHWVG